MKLITRLLFFVLINLIVTKSNAQILGSLNFNGNDNYVEITNSPLNTINNGDFTIEAWIKGKENEQTAHPMIFSNRGTSFSQGILFFFHDQWSNSQFKMLCFQVNGDNYFLIDNGSYNGSVLDGQCHHVAITRNGDMISFYVDGNEIGNRTIPGSSTVNFVAPLWIGKDGASNNTFNGIISQCRIWNIARTQSQINESKEISLQGNETGLIAYWEMNNENGQTVTDKKGQFHGVLGSSAETEIEDPSWSDDGCIEETIISVDNNKKNFSLQVLPNPTSGLITIQHQSTKKLTLYITSATGKLILSKEFNESTLNLNISDYPEGIYFLQIRSEGHVISRKIVKS